MFSWFDCCIDVLRGFLFGWVKRGVVGGWILCLGRVGVGWDLGVWLSRVGMSRNLGFSGGFVMVWVGVGVGCGCVCWWGWGVVCGW